MSEFGNRYRENLKTIQEEKILNRKSKVELIAQSQELVKQPGIQANISGEAEMAFYYVSDRFNALVRTLLN